MLTVDTKVPKEEVWAGRKEVSDGLQDSGRGSRNHITPNFWWGEVVTIPC